MKKLFQKLASKLLCTKKEKRPFFLSLVGTLSQPATHPTDLMHFCTIYICAKTFAPVIASVNEVKTMWLGETKDTAKKAFVFRDSFIVFVGEQEVFETNVKTCPFKKRVK